MNASAKKMTSGRFAFTSASSHSQKASDLVWGLSTRNTVMPWSIQYPTTAASSSQSSRHCGVSKSIG